MSKRGGGGDRKRKAPKSGKGDSGPISTRKKSTRPRRSALKEARARLESLMSANVRVVAKDPLRSHILAIAIQRPYSPSEFARDLEIHIGIASYHFKVLKDNGIIELVDRVRVGGAYKHMYRANESAFISNADWGQLDEAMRPGFLGTILHDFSMRVMLAIEVGTMFSRDDFTLYWAPQDLDEIAYKEQVEIIAWCIEESKRLEVDTVERRAEGKSERSSPVTFAIASFLSPTHKEVKRHKAEGRGGEARARGKGRPKGKSTKRKGKGGGK
jgi:DNA-binding transcriptional ArsR family regulator